MGMMMCKLWECEKLYFDQERILENINLEQASFKIIDTTSEN